MSTPAPTTAPSLLLPVLDCEVAIVGGGPAGLMAAEHLAAQGRSVQLFDAKASLGRKLLLAGRGGLNLTHSEGFEPFVARYGAAEPWLRTMLQAFGADQLRDWAQGLGIETFVGSSGRVFPRDMKAAPLLRAWLGRLNEAGVQWRLRHRCTGWGEDGCLLFATPAGVQPVRAQAVVLALGGGSWARLGSDGAWLPWLQARGVEVEPLQAANCGFDVGAATEQGAHGETRRDFIRELVGLQSAPALGWSAHFRERFAGQPFKSVRLHFEDLRGQVFDRRGEFVATATGVEGSLVYAVSQLLRDTITAQGLATFWLDLMPDWSAERVEAAVRHPRGARSLSSHLKGRLGLDGVKLGLLYEVLGPKGMQDAGLLARAIKAVPVTVVAARPMDEAISTAGGVRQQALDAQLMCQALPGVFCAGEMLDWEAPTGGYLLTACLATGVVAAQGVHVYLAQAGQGGAQHV